MDCQTMIESRSRSDAPHQREYGQTTRSSGKLRARRTMTTDIARVTTTSLRALARRYRLVRHGDALLRHAERTSRSAEQTRREGGVYHLQTRRPRRRPRQRSSRRAIPRQRSRPRPFRIPLGRPVQSRLRPRKSQRISRRNASGRRRKARAFLLDVRSAFLLDENYAGRARIRQRTKSRRRKSIGGRNGGESGGIREKWKRNLSRQA